MFEITSDALGAQSTVCGGGRYNGLVEELGGKPTEGMGFAIGLERLIMILKSQDKAVSGLNRPKLFVAAIGDEAVCAAQALVYELRKKGIAASADLCGRSVKAQMKYANKIGAEYTVVLGEDEIRNNTASVKEMETGNCRETGISAVEIAECLK